MIRKRHVNDGGDQGRGPIHHRAQPPVHGEARGDQDERRRGGELIPTVRVGDKQWAEQAGQVITDRWVEKHRRGAQSQVHVDEPAWIQLAVPQLGREMGVSDQVRQTVVTVGGEAEDQGRDCQ